MPRYHFNIRDGHSTPDPDGIELPDLSQAKIEAARRGGEILRDNAAKFWEREDWRIDVTDAAGLQLFSITIFATMAAATAR